MFLSVCISVCVFLCVIICARFCVRADNATKKIASYIFLGSKTSSQIILLGQANVFASPFSNAVTIVDPLTGECFYDFILVGSSEGTESVSGNRFSTAFMSYALLGKFDVPVAVQSRNATRVRCKRACALRGDCMGVYIALSKFVTSCYMLSDLGTLTTTFTFSESWTKRLSDVPSTAVPATSTPAPTVTATAVATTTNIQQGTIFFLSKKKQKTDMNQRQ